VDESTAIEIMGKMKSFLKDNPPGSKLSGETWGEPWEVEVTRFSRCLENKEFTECAIELKHTKYGGYANYEVNPKTGRVTITGADFPYPLEFIIARDNMKLPIERTDEFCIRGKTYLHCPHKVW